MYTDHIKSHMCSSSLLVLPFGTRTSNGAQICRSHQSINMAQVQALSIAEIIAHTKQQPLPKLTSSKALSSGERELQVLCQAEHHTIVIVKYDMEIPYVYKIRIHEERELDFVS